MSQQTTTDEVVGRTTLRSFPSLLLGELFKTFSLFTCIPFTCNLSDFFLRRSVPSNETPPYYFTIANLLLYPLVTVFSAFVFGTLLIYGNTWLAAVQMFPEVPVFAASIIAAILFISIHSTINYDGYMDTWDALRCFPKDPYTVMKDPHAGALATVYTMFTAIAHVIVVATIITQYVGLSPNIWMALQGGTVIACCFTVSKCFTVILAASVLSQEAKCMLSDRKTVQEWGQKYNKISTYPNFFYHKELKGATRYGILTTSSRVLCVVALLTLVLMVITINAWHHLSPKELSSYVLAPQWYYLSLMLVMSSAAAVFYLLWLSPKYKILGFINGDVLGFSAIALEVVLFAIAAFISPANYTMMFLQ